MKRIKSFYRRERTMDSGLELGDSFESCFDLDNLPENITQNNFPAIDRFRRENEKL
ncbi:MAG: hypothetical protein ACLUZ1_12845 [Coprococcus sp.]|jgi:hypothetical protein